jgi:leucyl aminopeptidase
MTVLGIYCLSSAKSWSNWLQGASPGTHDSGVGWRPHRLAAHEPGTSEAPGRAMKVEVREAGIPEVEADLLAVGLYDGEELPPELAGAAGAADAKGAFEKLALLHPERPGRVLAAGLGRRSEMDAERARVAAALAVREAGKLDATSLAWLLPESGEDAATAAALVTGTILGAYRFDRFRSGDPDDPPPPVVQSLTLLAPAEVAAAAEAAGVCAEAQNRARDLQGLPSNVATPSYLAGRAEEIADGAGALEVEVLGREEIAAKGMGGLAAVSRGAAEEPKLIVLRYAGGGSGPTLGLVGKGVTFDTGGISIKPSAGMEEMKMDMSGAAAVLEAVAAIAELGLAVDLVAVVPATENMPSGTATKPGDIITQYNGKTVEVNNTDAEGRLILADALAYAVELGAERIVDLATLTGAVLVALGSTYAALISNEDALAAEVEAAGESTGELVWRLPLHPEYKELTKGTVADLTNAAAKRKAGTIYAGSFLEEFVGDTPWAHIDIAGTAWDVGRPYTGKSASGYGVRLLVELAHRLSGA